MRINTYKIILITTFCFFLQGCASSGFGFNLDEDSPSSQPFEAQYRLLLVTNKGGENHDKRVVCAEPSPDAMKALGVNGKLDYNNVGVGVKTMEAMAELGERTALIQLLRDNLYRSCEAYMNGLLSAEDYKEMLAFWDIYTVTLLGIDSLSSTTRQPLSISAGSTAEDSSSKASSPGKQTNTATGTAKPSDASTPSPSNSAQTSTITVNVPATDAGGKPTTTATDKTTDKSSSKPPVDGKSNTGNQSKDTDQLSDKAAVAKEITNMQSNYFCMKAVLVKAFGVVDVENLAKHFTNINKGDNDIQDRQNAFINALNIAKDPFFKELLPKGISKDDIKMLCPASNDTQKEIDELKREVTQLTAKKMK